MNSPDRSGITVSARSYTTFWDTIRVDTIARVRRAFHIQNWSMKKIVRELHVSRNTVRKILRTDETDFSYERERQPMPRIGPWQGQLEQFLSSSAGKPSRERLTLIRIFEVEGYSAIGSRNTPTARAGIRGRLRCSAPVRQGLVADPGGCDDRGLCPTFLRSG